jgi:ComF family protein
MRNALIRVAAAALDLVAPPVCLSCHEGRQARAALCERCLHLVRPQPAEPCSVCAGPLGPGGDPAACPACDDLRPKFEAAVAVGPYPGLLGELVRRAKYGRDPVLAAPLAALLGSAVRSWPAGDGVTVVVPVPGTRSRLRERGFHLAELLAERVADDLGARLESSLLERVGDPQPQAALPRTSRRRAARGTVGLRHSHLPWPRHDVADAVVLVVDDVMTTGATVNECARVLLAAGAAEVRVAVCARA